MDKLAESGFSFNKMVSGAYKSLLLLHMSGLGRLAEVGKDHLLRYLLMGITSQVEHHSMPVVLVRFTFSTTRMATAANLSATSIWVQRFKEPPQPCLQREIFSLLVDLETRIGQVHGGHLLVLEIHGRNKVENIRIWGL